MRAPTTTDTEVDGGTSQPIGGGGERLTITIGKGGGGTKPVHGMMRWGGSKRRTSITSAMNTATGGEARKKLSIG